MDTIDLEERRWRARVALIPFGIAAVVVMVAYAASHLLPLSREATASCWGTVAAILAFNLERRLMENTDLAKQLHRRLLAAFMVCSVTASLPATEFLPAGDLLGGAIYSELRGVSANGSRAAGMSSAAIDGAVLWTEVDGLTPIAARGFAQAISGDGSTVVGGVFNQSTGATEPFVWNNNSGITMLGFPSGISPSGLAVAEDVSADGSIVVGATSFGGNSEAFRWTEGGGFQSLTQQLPGSPSGSSANGISADGKVIVGGTTGSYKTAFRWTSNDGGIVLGDLPGGQLDSSATAVSADGTVVVGTSNSEDSPIEAFRWTEETGMVGLGFLSDSFSQTVPLGVTGSGEAIVGRNDSFDAVPDVSAFLWTHAFGLEDLQVVLGNRFGLASELNGWNLTSATDISSDGMSIVGIGINPNGNTEGWLVRLDQPIFVPEPRGGLMGLFVIGSYALLQFRRQ
ncbi:hypothetical protein [Aeoliella mucimassa]|uniref:Uncharacterized protein n=1 Tax=Aeoliella mucimassa TaxID=2527972 RepID=A0A518ALH4_9BACT|nr:hypothetical protein [Aeoliella mucimassa]QDU55561.1 hypothetical protein Pan181_17530 [Aeoliella mucimassa]